MKIALSTVGSTGDIQPYLALGKELIAAGHDVKALSHPFHAPRFEKNGIPFQGCGTELTEDGLNAKIDRMISALSPLKQLRILMEEGTMDNGDQYFADVKAGMAGSDLAICHMIDFYGHEAALQMGIPRISTIFAPAGIPNKYASPLFAPDWLPFTKFWWWLMTATMKKLDGKVINELEKVGGTEQEVKRFYSLAPELNLIAASPLIAPTYPDLPTRYKVTGPWLLPEPDFVPSAELLSFLERHPKPVIVSLGSMGGLKGPELTRKILKAIELVGCPAIVQSGYANLFQKDAPTNVFFAGYVPHGWLFEKGLCVVHHGGAGTSTAACRAGVPSIVIPFIADQPYFATNIRKLGLAPKMLWHYRLTARRLARRIQIVIDNPSMQAKAKQLRPQFLAEEGTEKAINTIEDFAKQKGIL